jgi:uncharacterized protein (UPF0332 family)
MPLLLLYRAGHERRPHGCIRGYPTRVTTAGPPRRVRYTQHEQALLRVSKADKKTLGLMVEGVYLSTSTARTLPDLQEQTCADRLRFARELLGVADKLARSRPAQYRSAISRYYYAMYHAMRAVVYYAHGGDDHNEHKVLPSHVPQDFVDSALWQNNLKDARAHRNDADYDPYPLDPNIWRDVALDLRVKSHQLIVLTEDYLRRKGCAHI